MDRIKHVPKQGILMSYLSLGNRYLHSSFSVPLPSSKMRAINTQQNVQKWWAWTQRKPGLRLGQHQVSGDEKRITNSVGVAVLAHLFSLRASRHEITPGQFWSILQLQHTLQLRIMTNQVMSRIGLRAPCQSQTGHRR